MALATILDSYGIACSASSACDANGDAEAPLSHVLLASGLKPEIIKMKTALLKLKSTDKNKIIAYVNLFNNDEARLKKLLDIINC